MADSATKKIIFDLNPDTGVIPDVVRSIKETWGKAYSTFSGRPLSLCKSMERRGELRVKFEEPILLWPVKLKDDRAFSIYSQPIVSVSRDISLSGIGFGYDEEIETDYVVVEIDLFGGGTELLLVELRWKSFIDSHSYVAGGMIRRQVRPID